MEQALFHWIKNFFKLDSAKTHYQLVQTLFHLFSPDDFKEPDFQEEDNWALNLKNYEELKKQLGKYNQQTNLLDLTSINNNDPIQIIQLYYISLLVKNSQLFDFCPDLKIELLTHYTNLSKIDQYYIELFIESEYGNQQQNLTSDKKKELLDKIDEMEMENQKYLQQVNNLEQENEDLKKQYSKLNSGLMNRESELSLIKEQLQQKKNEVNFEELQQSTIDQQAKKILQLEQQLRESIQKNLLVENEINQVEMVKLENERLNLRIQNLQKIEKKYENLNEKLENNNLQQENDRQYLEEQIERLQNKYHKLYQDYQKCKEQLIGAQFENEKTLQQLESIKIEKNDNEEKYQKTVEELSIELERLNEKNKEMQNQSFVKASPRNFNSDFLTSIENQKFKLQEQVEQITQAKYEQKNFKEQQLLKERIKTLEAQLNTQRRENAKTLKEVNISDLQEYRQLVDIKDQLELKIKNEQNDNVEQYIEAALQGKNQQILLLSSLLLDIKSKYDEQSLNYTAILKESQRPPLQQANKIKS